MDISDGDLVRLARDGDPAAFRLLVERHLPMARARAARLCPQPEDADDAVQDAFLQAFIALDRLRDRGGSSLTAPGSDWTWHEVTMPVPGDAGIIRFGISLTRRGRVELRNAELSPARPQAAE